MFPYFFLECSTFSSYLSNFKVVFPTQTILLEGDPVLYGIIIGTELPVPNMKIW